MPELSIWVCPTCGANFPPADNPPPGCPVCEDERQWVPPDGQKWVTLAGLAKDGYRTEVREVEPGLLGVGVEPGIGVGQRGLLVCTGEGNLLWDPPAYIDEAAIAAVRGAGELRAVSASHPHMYGAIVEWSRDLGAEILLPEADAGWLMRPEAPVRRWTGTAAVLPGVTLVQCGGHFPGSAVVHWAAGAHGRGALLCGDTLFVTPGEDRLTFVYSAPNRLPLSERAVRGVVQALAPYAFDRVYSGWWTPVLGRDAKAVLDRSAQRYIELLRGD
jgi:glyoxylase-like metal-dependent hydrolase (beta-lactamase superfamily II)